MVVQPCTMPCSRWNDDQKSPSAELQGWHWSKCLLCAPHSTMAALWSVSSASCCMSRRLHHRVTDCKGQKRRVDVKVAVRARRAQPPALTSPPADCGSATTQSGNPWPATHLRGSPLTCTSRRCWMPLRRARSAAVAGCKAMFSAMQLLRQCAVRLAQWDASAAPGS